MKVELHIDDQLVYTNSGTTTPTNPNPGGGTGPGPTGPTGPTGGGSTGPVASGSSDWTSLLRNNNGQYKLPNQQNNTRIPLSADWQSIKFRLPQSSNHATNYDGYIKLITDNETPQQEIEMQARVTGDAQPFYSETANNHQVPPPRRWGQEIEVLFRTNGEPQKSAANWAGVSAEIALPEFNSTFVW